MRKDTIIKSLLLGSLLFTSAQAKNVNFIEIGAGAKKTTDNFVATEDNASDNSATQTIPNIQFAYNINLSQNYTAYVKSKFGKIFLGSTYKLNNNNKIDFGLVSNLISNEEWQNPFKRDENAKTDVSEKGAYISYAMRINQDLNTKIKYQHIKKDYDNDTVIESLKREGTKNTISLENMYKGYIVNLKYDIYNADGSASSYKAYKLALGKVFSLSNKLSLLAIANVGELQYDEINTERNTKIDATTYGLVTQLKYKEPFSYKNTYISLSSGFDKEDANDDFYNKKNVYGIVSLGFTY